MAHLRSQPLDDYFGSVAARYQERSSRGLWGRVRQRESAAVLALLGPLPGRSVLDLGCGAGFYTCLALEAGAARVSAVDRSAAMLARLPRSGVTAVQADAAELSLDTAHDRGICAGLLEFVPDPAAVLAAAGRSIAPGGRLVVLVPRRGIAGFFYSAFHRSHGVAARCFTLAQLAELAGPAGWSLRDHATVAPLALVAAFDKR